MTTLVEDKKADLAGPGIGDYKELEDILPRDYNPLLTRKRRSRPFFSCADTSKTIYAKSLAS